MRTERSSEKMECVCEDEWGQVYAILIVCVCLTAAEAAVRYSDSFVVNLHICSNCACVFITASTPVCHLRDKSTQRTLSLEIPKKYD